MKWYVLTFGFVLVRKLLVQRYVDMGWSIYMLSEEDGGTRQNKEHKGEDIDDCQ